MKFSIHSLAICLFLFGCGGSGGGEDILPGLDIAISNVGAPATAAAGDQFEVQYTVENVGSVLASGIMVQVLIGRSVDPVEGHTRASFDVVMAMLQPGDSSSGTIDVQLPGQFPGGDYILTVDALIQGESDRSDNTDSVAMTITGPPCEADEYENDDGPDSATVIGNGDEQLHNLCFDGTDWTRFEATAGTTYIARTAWWPEHFDVGPEGPYFVILDEDGETVLAEGIGLHDLPAATYEATRDGTHYLVVVASTFDDIGAGSGYSLTFGMPRPDLMVDDFYHTSDAVAGGVADFQYYVANIGYDQATPSQVKVLVSPDSTFETNVIEVRADSLPALNADSGERIDTYYTVPSNLSGTLYAVAVADPDDQVLEMSETNNRSQVHEFEVSPPICTPDNREEDDHIGSANPIALDTTIAGNHCDDTVDFQSFDAEAGVQYLLLMSYDTISATEEISIYDSDGTFLVSDTDGMYWTPSEGGTFFINAGRLTIHNGLDSDYTLRIEKALPNLTSGGSFPAQATAGTWISVLWSVSNLGTAPAGASTISFYLSADGVVDLTDRLLGTATVIDLPAGMGGSGQTRILIPDDVTPGSYTVATIADAVEAIAETDETDNVGTPQSLDVIALTCSTDSYEQDDDQGNASPIALDEVQSRNQCDDGVDWISFNGVAGGSYLVTFDPLGGFGHDDEILIYDTDGTTLLVDGSNHAFVDHVYFSPPANGTYFIKLGDNLVSQGNAGNPRAYEAHVRTCALDAYEQNDESGAAKAISAGETQTHNLCDDNTDWLSFTATAGTTYTIETNLVGANLSTSLRLEDDSGGLIDQNSGVPGPADSRIIWTATASGTFYVRVQSTFDWGPDSEYTVSLEAAP